MNNMPTTKTFKFRLAGLSITAPSTWHKPPFLKRLLYPSQPELCGPGGPGYEFLWFEKPISFGGIPKFSEMAEHLIGTVQIRGNSILSEGTISINNVDYPTITFEKHKDGYAPTIMKRYFVVLNNKSFTMGARLSHNNLACYPEEGYDKIVKSIVKI